MRKRRKIANKETKIPEIIKKKYAKNHTYQQPLNKLVVRAVDAMIFDIRSALRHVRSHIE